MLLLQFSNFFSRIFSNFFPILLIDCLYHQISTLTLALDQLLVTALLLLLVSAVSDQRNMAVSSGEVPLLIGMGLTAILFRLD
jgi:glycerol uptake facilitator-like aquaporin